MPIPTTTTAWATNPDTDPTYGDNKVQPSAAIIDTGLDAKEPLARPYLNYELNSLSNWIDHIINDKLKVGTESVIDLAYPVGSVYMSTVATNPSTLFGFGTWVAIEGKFLVGVDSGDTDFDTPLETGGHKDLTGQSTEGHTLTVSEIPSHTHDITLNARGLTTGGDEAYSPTGSTPYDTTSDGGTGGGGSHSHGLDGVTNLPPYLAVYMWRRTA